MTSPTDAPDSDVARLRRLVACSRKTSNALSKLAGLSPAHIGMILRGDIKAVSRDTAKALSNVTGCSVGWLLAGEGEEPNEDDVAACVNAFASAPDAVRLAPDPIVVRDGYDQRTGTEG